MTVAAYAHPFNISQSVLVCRSTHLSPTIQVKLAQLACRDGYQIVLVGPFPPELVRKLGDPTIGFTPEARSADVVTVPSTQHALAHMRASTRDVFIINAAGDVIASCDATLARSVHTARQVVHPAA